VAKKRKPLPSLDWLTPRVKASRAISLASFFGLAALVKVQIQRLQLLLHAGMADRACPAQQRKAVGNDDLPHVVSAHIKQLGDFPLGQPDGLILRPKLNLALAVVGDVQNQVIHASTASADGNSCCISAFLWVLKVSSS
jgi:hypothetical protein